MDASANPLPNAKHGPLFVRLTGTLGDVLHGFGQLEAVTQTNREGLLQRIRFWCSSAAFARLMRIKISSEGAQDWYITPMGPDDDQGIVRWVGAGQRLTVGLIRGEDVDPALVPAFVDTETFRLEVYG